MRDAVIVGAVRTPVGRRKGGLSHVHPADLSGFALRTLAERAGFDPADVEDVIWGCVSQIGDQAWVAAMDAKRRLLALRTWHTGKVTRDANHEFVGAWINGVNRDSSRKVKH